MGLSFSKMEALCARIETHGPVDFVFGACGALVGYIVDAARVRALRCESARGESGEAMIKNLLTEIVDHRESRDRKFYMDAVARLLSTSTRDGCDFYCILVDAIPRDMLDVDFLYGTGLPMSRLLRIAPVEVCTHAMFREALEEDGCAIEHIAEERIDESLALVAVTQDGNALKHVPEAMRTWQVCLRAVENCGGAILHVPEKHLRAWDFELPRISARTFPDALSLVPISRRTPELCQKVLALSCKCVPHIPESYLDERLCLDIVRRDRSAIALIPTNLINEFLCQVAVSCESDSPASIRASAGATLGALPREWRTARVCRIALRSDSLAALPHVPDKHLDELSCLALVREDWRALGLLPQDRRTWAVCASALAACSDALAHCPPKLRNLELCQMAISAKIVGANIGRDIPIEIFFPKLTVEIAEDVGFASELKKMCEWDIARQAIQRCPSALSPLVSRISGNTALFGTILPADILLHALDAKPELASDSELMCALLKMQKMIN